MKYIAAILAIWHPATMPKTPRTKQARQRGERLREIRERAGLSPDELARLAGIGHPGRRNGALLLGWEDGANSTVDALMRVIELLADRLGLSRGDLLAYLVWG